MVTIIMKQCTKCSVFKPPVAFEIYNKNCCDKCYSYNETYKLNNKDKLKHGQKNYRNKNKLKLAQKMAKWRANNPEKAKAAYRRSNNNRTVYFRNWIKQKRRENPIYLITHRLRSRLRKVLLSNKKLKTFDLIGSTPEFLKQHLESQFSPNLNTGEMMTWDNYPLWQIDHIKPCGTFDLTDL